MGVTKATLSVNDLLEGFPRFRKAVILTVMDSYSERIQIRISKGKGHMRQSPAATFQMSLPSGVTWGCP